MVCFLALVLETALRRKIKSLTEGNVPYYEALLRHLEQVKAVEITFDGKRYLARTELVGHADLAFRALGMRPTLSVTDVISLTLQGDPQGALNASRRRTRRGLTDDG